MVKVLLIDPWGTNNTSEYLNGLISGLSGQVDLTVMTNHHFEYYVKEKADIHRVFFKWSEKMKRSKVRTVIRGLEYLNGYRQVMKELASNSYDVVHINWLLNYRFDIRFLRKIRKYSPRIVYTAHNVLPHVNGEKYRAEMKQIYGLVDKIIVHGNAVKEELIAAFPETAGKVYIQKHGCVIKEPDLGSVEALPPDLRAMIDRTGKLFISCGAVFPNKGVDRIMKVWMDRFADADACLVVGGGQNGEYPEYDALKPLVRTVPNLALLDGFIADDVMNTLFSRCSAVVLPYRHASMSGIVFSAAQYAKPILCTDVGALTEYLQPGSDSLVCANDDKALGDMVERAINADQEELASMGQKLNANIRRECDWSRIASGIIQNAYQD